MEIFPVVLILSSYLVGSFPTAFLAGRWFGKKNITRTGSGSSGASNVWHKVSRKVAVGVILVDVIKGSLPVIVCRIFSLDIPVQVACSLAVLAGHNWSVFLRFLGGRGLATIVGFLILLAPKELAISGILVIAGILLKNVPLFAVLAIFSIPVFSLYFGREPVILLGEIIMVFLVIAKRLEANKGFGVAGGKWLEVMGCRLLFDRDIRDRETWINRG
ncbi:MAG: glycerol-3-phosphate acyltransferase [Dehalococcoidia bacterium]|nr:glycerol-3-phosphate acyltransferase [Dehalococcoidia bacterium]